MKTLATRIERLECVANTDRNIVIWCEDEGDQVAQVSSMIASGEIKPSDGVTCVYWAKAHSEPGAHERALTELGDG